MPVKISLMNRRSGDETAPPDSRGGPGRPQSTTVVYQMPRGPPQVSRVVGTMSGPPHSYGYGAPPPQVSYQRTVSGGAPSQQYHGGPPPTAQAAPGAERRYGPPHERYVERMEEDVRPQAGQGRIIREMSTERLNPSMAVRGSAPPSEGGAVVYTESYDPSEERVTFVRQGGGFSAGQGQYEIVHRVSSSPSTSPPRGELDSYAPGHPPGVPGEGLVARGRSYSVNSSETSEARSSPNRRPAGPGPAPAGPPREGDVPHAHMKTTRTIVLQNGPYPSHESSAPPESQRVQSKVQGTSAVPPHEIRRLPESATYEVRTRAHEHRPGERWREEGLSVQYGASAYDHHPRSRPMAENPNSSRSSPGRFVYNGVAGHPSHPSARPIHGDQYGPSSRQYYYEEYSHPRQQHDGTASHRVSFEREVEYHHHRQQDPHYLQRQRPMTRGEIAAEHQPPPPPPKGTRMVMRTVLGVANSRLVPEKDNADVSMSDLGGAPPTSIAGRVGADIGEAASKSGSGKPSDASGDDSANMGCTCKKSKCLKLYCQCFASKAMCGPNCRCLVCMNTVQYEQVRKDAINTILSRNPNAFDTKFKATSTGTGTEDGEDGQTKVAHKLGCKCRKSACLKKYCECYHANVKCSTNCRCVGCQNMPPGGPGGSKKSDSKVKIESSEPSMDEAVQQLTSLKNATAARPERSSSMSSIKDVPTVSLVTSDEADASVNEPPSSAEDSKTADTVTSKSDPNNESVGEKQVSSKPITSSSTEKKAGEGVNSLLMAAFAMTEMHKGNTPPGSPSSGPQKKPDKSAEPPEEPLPQKSAEIPKQETPERRMKKVPYRSPKRKSSEDSSDDSSGTGARKKYHYSPDSSARVLSRENSSIINLQADSRSDDDASEPSDRQKQMGTYGSPPATTPEQRKVKRSRLGSAKKAFRGGKQVHPFPFAQSSGVGSAHRNEQALKDEHMAEENKYGTPERTGSQKFKGQIDQTPQRKQEMKEALTPVSARCVELRKMEVNPDSGRQVGFDLESEGRV